LGSFFRPTGVQTGGIGPDLLGTIKVRIWVRLVIFMVQALVEISIVSEAGVFSPRRRLWASGLAGSPAVGGELD
jgi:hypothetical protein